MNDKEFKLSMCRMYNQGEDDYAYMHGSYQPRYISIPEDDIRHAPTKHRYYDMDTEVNNCGRIISDQSIDDKSEQIK